jgi:hypothetical protein
MTNTTPIIVNDEILSSIGGIFSKLSETGKRISKNQALNIITNLILKEERKNWGALKGADKPVIAKGMDPEAVRAALGATVGKTPGKVEFVAAIYTHPHGEDVNVFWTEDEAEQWRQDISEEYWSDAFYGEQYPEGDPKAAADRYFEKMLEKSFSEEFTVRKCALNMNEQGLHQKPIEETDPWLSAREEVRQLARDALASYVDVALSSLPDHAQERVAGVMDEILDEAANDYLVNHCPYTADLRGYGTFAVTNHVKQDHWMLFSERLAAATADPENWKKVYQHRNDDAQPAAAKM